MPQVLRGAGRLWQQMFPTGWEEKGSQGLFGTVGAWGQPEQGGKAPSLAGVGPAEPPAPGSLVEGGLTQRCFPGTKPPGSPPGAVTPTQPRPTVRPCARSLLLQVQGSPSPPLDCPCPLHCTLSPPHTSHPCEMQFGVSQWYPCPFLTSPPLLFPASPLPDPAGFCVPIHSSCPPPSVQSHQRGQVSTSQGNWLR